MRNLFDLKLSHVVYGCKKQMDLKLSHVVNGMVVASIFFGL